MGQKHGSGVFSKLTEINTNLLGHALLSVIHFHKTSVMDSILTATAGGLGFNFPKNLFQATGSWLKISN